MMCSFTVSLAWGNFLCFLTVLVILIIKPILQGNLHILFFVMAKSQTQVLTHIIGRLNDRIVYGIKDSNKILMYMYICSFCH